MDQVSQDKTEILTADGFTFSAPRLRVLWSAICRFPLPILAAVIFVLHVSNLLLTMIYALWPLSPVYELNSHSNILAGLCITGFFLLMGVALLAEGRHWRRPVMLAVSMLAFVGLAFAWLSLGNDIGKQHILLGFACFGFCVFAPALTGAKNNEVWLFNQCTFLGLGIAGIATGFSLICILLLQYTTSELLSFGFGSKIFSVVEISLAALFWPLYTITFMPRLPMAKADNIRMPGPLAFVLSYVALPILLVDALIIAIYGTMVLQTGESPKGSVSWMIVVFASSGITLHFLLYPLRDTGHVLVRWFYRWFFVLLLPYLALLFWALSLRISAYGLTEMRYLALMGGIWVALLCVYAVLSRERFRLAVAPAMLVAFLLLAAIGPLSAERMSFQSQEARLWTLLTEMGIVKDGQVQLTPVSDEVSWKFQRPLSEQLAYFDRLGDQRFPAYLDSARRAASRDGDFTKSDLLRLWNIYDDGRMSYGDERSDILQQVFRFDANTLFNVYSDQALSTRGFDWVIQVDTSSNDRAIALGHEDKLTYHIAGRNMVIKSEAGAQAEIDVVALLPQQVLRDSQLGAKQEPITTELSLGQWHIRLIIESATLRATHLSAVETAWSVQQVSGVMLISGPH